MLVENAERQLEEGREAYAARRWGMRTTPYPPQIVSSSWDPQIPSCFRHRRTCSAAMISSGWSAPMSCTWKLVSAYAPRAAPSGSGCTLVTRGELGPGTGWLDERSG